MLRLLFLPLCLSLFACIVTSDSRCFPSTFLFGTATTTTALQAEGAWNVSSQELSWDDYCRSRPDVQCTDVIAQFVHHYRKDAQRMSDMGLSSVQFSISWSRLMHWDAETERMQPNPHGIMFYHALLDALQAHALQPIVTLYYFDRPSILETQLEPIGWLNSDIATHFEDFAELAFREFGNKVKYWITFNDPLTLISTGYGSCDVAPCAMEALDTDTYIVAHNVLLSHARAVANFHTLQEESSIVAASARIGMGLSAEYGYSLDESNDQEEEAAEREMQLDLGWFLLPIMTGEYPKIMRERVGERLPRFSFEEAELVKESYDVLMLNQYCSRVVVDCESEPFEQSCGKLSRGTDHANGYLTIIKWLLEKDPSTEVLLTENSWCGDDEAANSDQLRYFQAHVEQMYKAIVEEKIPIIGYTVWPLLDNSEWVSYEPRSNRHYANSTSTSTQELSRLSRSVTKWFTHLSSTKCLDGWEQEMGINEKQDAAVSRENTLSLEMNGNGVETLWSLSEIAVLVVIGMIVLIAITCEAIRELHRNSQGTREELQILVTIED